MTKSWWEYYFSLLSNCLASSYLKNELFTIQSIQSWSFFAFTDFLESSVEDLLDEAKAMMRVSNHDHIVNIQGICVKNDVAYLLMEYCHSGCLYDYLQSNEESLRTKLYQQNDFSKFRNWICQVAEGMAFLAWNNVIHVNISFDYNISFSVDHQ